MTVRLVVLWMSLGVLAAFGLYNVKYRVQELKSEVAATETQLREEKKNLHVLTAEWTYLNRPERLRQLSAKYLAIKPLRAGQLADLASIPAQKPSNVSPTAEMQTHTPLGGSMTLASGALHAR